MHIPDGYIDPGVTVCADVLAAGLVGYAVLRAREELDEDRAPLVGATAAFVFATQMINFPVAGGTSGHFVGAALAAVLLGPWSACVVVSLVLAIQALVFADGGVLALGANVLNMAGVGALTVPLALAAARRVLAPGRTGLLAATGVAAWLAVMVAATATSLELAISAAAPLGSVLGAMLSVHAVIGIGEAAITVAAVAAVLAARPALAGSIWPAEPALAEAR